MIFANSIVGVRRTRVARFFATWLILLTVFPFTAPFATCDAAELTADMSVLDKRPCSKSLTDAIDASVIALICLPIAVLVPLCPAPEVAVQPDRSALLTVLRV